MSVVLGKKLGKGNICGREKLTRTDASCYDKLWRETEGDSRGDAPTRDTMNAGWKICFGQVRPLAN